MRRLAVLAAIFAFYTASASAASVPRIDQIAAGVCADNGQAVDEKSLDDATDIVNAVEQRNEGLSPTALGMMAMQLTIQEAQSHPAQTDQTSRLFQIAVTNELRKNLSDIVKAEACIYAVRYSPQELRQLRTFYLSPLGKKVIANGMPINAETVELGRALSQTNIGSEATERARKALSAQGNKP